MKFAMLSSMNIIAIARKLYSFITSMNIIAIARKLYSFILIQLNVFTIIEFLDLLVMNKLFDRGLPLPVYYCLLV